LSDNLTYYEALQLLLCYTSCMNRLQIYPTSRAIRSITEKLQHTEGFLPTLMRMDEFEKRSVVLEGCTMVDPLQRIMLLKEAASFEGFEKMKIDRSLVRFFTKSDAIFKFFEEIALEGVTLQTLAKADPYAEFETHLALLEELRERYRLLLDERGLSDRMFIPQNYTLNTSFIESYSHIEIHLEGYLSRFELALLQRVSQHTPVTICYTTTPFTKKMQERFEESIGVKLPLKSRLKIDLKEAKVVEQTPYKKQPKATLFSVEERGEQVALALAQIEQMVQQGIAPDEIALILPDESFKSHFMLFDYLNNLNFAMGYDYANSKVFRSLETLYTYWQSYESETFALLKRYGVDEVKVTAIDASKGVSVEAFFAFLEALSLLDTTTHQELLLRYEHFTRLFRSEQFSYTQWLFLWLKSIEKITLDDVRGGKVTVMGVLETRGVSFKGVVIVDFNEGIVPATSSKDAFLNSAVRTFAKLPTRHDREALQKHYYYRILQEAQEAVVIYATAENKLPSKFLYELGLPEAKATKAPLHLLYAQPSQLVALQDPHVEAFDATQQVWSASKLKTFLTCKRKFYYRYIEKIKAKAEDELNEGALLHRALENLYQDVDHYDDAATLSRELHRHIAALLPQETPLNRYKRALWQKRLQGFVEEEIAHFKAGWRVVEKEKEIEGTIGGLTFKGRIDRIDQNSTDTLVLDYKSGRVAKEPKKLNPEKITDFQMAIYHQLLQKRYQHISLAYIKLFEQGQKQFVTLLDEQEALLAEHVVSLKQTTSFVAQKCDALENCRFCEFALMCERGEYL